MKTAATDRRFGLTALAFVAAVLAYRLLLLAIFPYDLYGDEAQYWVWSLTPDWGYYSKPPMIAWIITATTALFGDGLFGIKLGAPLLHAATALLMFLLGRRLADARAGLWAAVVYTLMPAVGLSSFIISTDAPLLFFWALSLYCLIRAFDDGDWSWWLATGAAAGLGLLSKYNMGLFLVCALLYVLWSPERRHWLRSPRPWAGALVAALIYSTNLAWNWANDFVSYRHTHDISHLDRSDGLHPENLLSFFGEQFAVFGPIAFALLLIVVLRRTPRPGDDRMRLLLSFVLPWFVAIGLLSLLSRANANWGAPMYVGGTLLLVIWLLERRLTGWLKAALAFNLVLVLGMYHYDALMRAVGAEMTRAGDPYKFVRGWSELGRQTEELMRRYPDAVLVTDHRMTAAQLLYYARGVPVQRKWNPGGGGIGDHFDLTIPFDPQEAGTAIYVSYVPRRPVAHKDPLTDRYADVESLDDLVVPIHRDHALHYRVFRLSDHPTADGELPPDRGMGEDGAPEPDRAS